MTPVTSLDQLVADGIVDAIIQRVKTGKEAEVFIVRKGEHYFAAKVYKERTARTFKNNVGYKEGRVVRNSRDARALTKGSKYGTALSEKEWMHTEHDVLSTLMHAGCRVPKPELFYEDVLLMELVLGADGQPAPRLIEVPLSKDEAVAYHHDIVSQIIRMMTQDVIHGDLSPYNILLAWNGPTIIDLPQAVKAAHNTQAEEYLVRDVRNVTEYFSKFAPELQSRVLDGLAIWKKYAARELSTDYFPAEGESQGLRMQHQKRRPKGRRQPSAAPPPPPPVAAAPKVEPVVAAAPVPPPIPQRREHVPAPPRTMRPSGPRPQQHARPNGAPSQQQPVAARGPTSGYEAPRTHQPRPPGQHPNSRPQQHRDGPRPQGPRADQQGQAQGPRNDGPRPPRVDGPRPPRPDGPRPPPRRDGPRPPNHNRPPAGPVVERVQRMTPASTGPSNEQRPERPSRFGQHHRNRG